MKKEVEIRNAVLNIHHAEILRDAPTIIFLHDSLGCIKLWRDFPERLARATNCNYLVYDRQGYGGSDPFFTAERKKDYLETEADVLNKLLEKKGIDDAILFGHSDGGSIALIAAAKYPERISAVIAEAPHIFVEEFTLKGLRDWLAVYRSSNNLKERLQKYHGDKTDAVVDAWTRTWLAEEYRDWNIEHFMEEITCPVLIIQGTNDEFGSLAQVEAIINQVSGPAEQFILPDIGHSPHKEAAEPVLERSKNFIHAIR